MNLPFVLLQVTGESFIHAGNASHQGAYAERRAIDHSDRRVGNTGRRRKRVSCVSVRSGVLAQHDIAYAHDLSHLWQFLAAQRLSWYQIRPVHTVEFLQFLRRVTTLHRTSRSSNTLTNCRHGSLQRSMFWGNKFAPAKPKNADFGEQQKHNAIIDLRFASQKTPGNTRCFYRHFSKQK
jgi:hypothetical protein